MYGLLKSSIKTLLLGIFMSYVYRFGVHNGVGVSYNNVNPGYCRVVPGIQCGSEQISVTKNGLAFITSGFRLETNCNLDYIKGGIYLFDFNNPDNNVTRLEIIGGLDTDAFEPHGMDVLENDDKIIDIYVVNHANHCETIEVFEYDISEPTILQHKKTLRHKHFVCLNSIAIVAKEIFYVTNYVRYCNSGFPGLVELEFLYGLRTSNILYYNKGSAKIMTENEIFLNGISLSNDKTKVFSVLTKPRLLFVFDRNIDTGVLTKTSEHYLSFIPDNVYTDKQTGHLYIGTIKNEMCEFAYTLNLTTHCYAAGTKVAPKSDDWSHVDIQEMLHMDGKDFVSVTSSFVHYKGHYLSGTVFEKLGYCKDRTIM